MRPEVPTVALAIDIHGLSHQLHSSKLRHLGLHSAMRELCAQMSRQHGIEVNLIANPMPENISQDRALCLYRVTQDALKNAVKHSGAPRIEVELAAEDGLRRMLVRDDGQGFDVNHYHPGLELASMRERLRMIGGVLDVRSAPREQKS